MTTSNSPANAAIRHQDALSDRHARFTSRVVATVALLGCALACSPILFAAAPVNGEGRTLDEGTSASMAGVIHDADQSPADLTSAHTYQLPEALDPQWTAAQLRQRFGASNVTIADLDVGEGETARGLVLFDKDPSRRAEIFVEDPDHLGGISAIRVRGENSRWHLDNGVYMGMTLDALVALNGKPITFSGLDWDYGGGILDWNAGKLAPKKDDNAVRSVSLEYLKGAKDRTYPSGDSEFRSDSRKFPRQGSVLHVGQLIVSFGIDD